MKKLNQRATRTFLKLIDGLVIGDARCIDNSSPHFMPVYVDRLSEHLYAIAHRSHRDEDRLPDPDVEFYVTDEHGGDGKAVYPTAIDHFHAVYQRMVDLDAHSGAPTEVVHAGQAGLASFCNTWMRNIAWQQDLNAAAAPSPGEHPSMEGEESDA